MSGLVAATIDLSPFFGLNASEQASRVLSGAENGKKAREETGFDALLLQYQAGRVDIVLPRETRSVNPSFLEEFIKNAVTEFGQAGFREKVFFSGAENFSIDSDLSEAMRRVQRCTLA